MTITANAERKTSAGALENEIQALIADWAEAHRGKDPDRVMCHYADGNVQFLMAPPLQYDAARPWDRNTIAAWFSTFDGPLGYEAADVKITSAEDIAFAHFLNRLSGVAIHGGPFTMWNRMTLGLRKTGGKWRITHVHSSVPFYMDGSFRAAVDLQP